MMRGLTAQRSWWWRAARAMLLCYAGAAVFAWLVSDRLLFQPGFGSRREPAGALKIRTKNGAQLSALFLPNPSARLTLWYFHGNAEDLGDIEPRLRALHAAGFAVFACEYPGYGVSDGPASESAVYASVEAGLEYLRQTCGVPAERVVAYGSSLGGGAAVELAARERIAGLILQSAFTSAYRVMTRWPLLPFDKFENLKKMPAVRCPVLIIHGSADEVVPFHHGEALFAVAPEPKRFIRVPAGRHNDLTQVMGAEYGKALREFVAGL